MPLELQISTSWRVLYRLFRRSCALMLIEAAVFVGIGAQIATIQIKEALPLVPAATKIVSMNAHLITVCQTAHVYRKYVQEVILVNLL